MKRNWIKFAAVGTLAAGMVFAQVTTHKSTGEAKAHVAGRAMARRNRMMQALNLTDAQKQQAKTIFQQSRQSVAPVLQQLKQNRETLAAAVKSNDTAKIQQLSATQGQLRGQVMAARAEAMAKFYQTLTPEQRAKAEQMHQHAKSRMSRMAARHNG
jgi:periplasmic protein CpxP/Spy